MCVGFAGSAYAKGEVCPQIDPCLLSVSFAMKVGSVLCKDDTIHYTIVSEKVHLDGYPPGKYTLKDWEESDIFQANPLDAFLPKIENDLYVFHDGVNACLDKAFPDRAQTLFVSSVGTITAEGQSDAQDFDQTKIASFEKEAYALLSEETRKTIKALVDTETDPVRRAHVFLGLMRGIGIGSAVFSDIKKTLREIYPTAPQELNPRLHYVPVEPAVVPDAKLRQADITFSFVFSVRADIVALDPQTDIAFNVKWPPPRAWCWPPCITATSTYGGGLLAMTSARTPYLFVPYEYDFPIDLCFLIHLRFSVVTQLAVSPPPTLAVGGALGLRGRFWKVNGTQARGYGFEARAMPIFSDPQGSSSDFAARLFVGPVVTFEPAPFLGKGINAEVDFGGFVGEGAGGYVGLILYEGSRQPPTMKGGHK